MVYASETRVFIPTSQQSLEYVERVRGGKTHNPHPALFHLNLLKETQQSSYHTGLDRRPKALSILPLSAGKAGACRREAIRITPSLLGEWAGSPSLDGSIPEPLLTSAASSQCPWRLFRIAYPAAGKHSGPSVSSFLSPQLLQEEENLL